jgi:hypothetical protein
MNEYNSEIIHCTYLDMLKNSSIKIYTYTLTFNNSDDTLTDTMLERVPLNTTHLIINRSWCVDYDGVERPSVKPVRIGCTSEKLGSLNLLGIDFQCVVEGLESDSVFKHCKRLEYIGIGCHKNPIFSTIQVLNRLPLKALNFQGWGIVNGSDTFIEFRTKIEETVCISVLF